MTQVEVYYNLHKKCLSVRDTTTGLVVKYTHAIRLKGDKRGYRSGLVYFNVSEKGRQRVIESQQKNVHAYVKGCVILNKVKGLEERKARKPKTLRQVTYNPYKYETFVYGSNPAINSNNHEPILWSSRVRLTHIDGDKARIDAVPCIKSANCY